MNYYFHRNFRVLCLSIAIFPSILSAQNKLLSYQQAFENGTPKLTHSFNNELYWLSDTEFHLIEKNDEQFRIMSRNASDLTNTELIDVNAVNEYLPEGYDIRRSSAHTDDLNLFLFNLYGNLSIYDIDKQKFNQLTQDEAIEKNPTFSPDGKKIAYTKQKNLYVFDLETNEELQLTEDGSEVVYNGWASWVYYEEILGRSSKYKAFWWAPNSEKIAFMRFDDSEVPIFPIYNADGVHGFLEITRYPKAGDPSPEVHLGIYSLATDKTNWVDLDTTMEYTAWPFWTPDAEELFYQQMNRDQNQLHVLAANAETAVSRSVLQQQDPAWIEFHEQMYFLPEKRGFVIKSDVEGWAHLYQYDMEGKLEKPLTNGSWQVFEMLLMDTEDEQIFFMADKGNSNERHLFSLSLKDDELTQITQQAGFHSCDVSDGGSYIIDRYSNIEEPTQIQLITYEGKVVETIHTSRLPEMQTYALGKVELFNIPIENGPELPALWVLPPDFSEDQQYPIIFDIYGGPASARVQNSFQPLYKHYYAQQGIITIAVDHRGSRHFGKEGQRILHRNLGKWEIHDLTEAVKWLQKLPFIDSSKVGITGGSYGGYVTSLALTMGAEYFTHGVSRAPVTDWRLYDNVYTERYMDTPSDNEEGYNQGSVLTHAEKYKGNGKLLLTHGTIDDNVHMQNTIQLVDMFTDNDQQFELMLYPNERHGYSFPKRKHYHRLATQFWFKHFLNRELPF